MALVDYPHARTVIIARHLAQISKPDQANNDWFPEATLKDDQAVVAERIRLLNLAPHWITYGAHSPLVRAAQTYGLLSGTITNRDIIAKLGPIDLSDWDFLLKAKTGTAREAWELNPGFMEAIGQDVATVARYALDSIAQGRAALIVTHNPFAEMGTAALLGKVGPEQEFGKGDIHVFQFTEEGLVGDEHFTAPTAEAYAKMRSERDAAHDRMP